jgi:hypothetical protein
MVDESEMMFENSKECKELQAQLCTKLAPIWK